MSTACMYDSDSARSRVGAAGRFLARMVLVLAFLSWGAVDAFAQPEEAERPQAGAVPPAPEVKEETLNQWAFGANSDAAAAQTVFECLLALQLDYVERTCGTSAAQKTKLQLAGRGDIKRFFDEVDAWKRTLRLSRNDGDAVNKLAEELQNHRNAALNGLFGDRSIFAKTLSTTLTPKQLASYQESLRRSVAYRHRAQIELMVQIVDTAAGLRDDQRVRLEKLLWRETRPLKTPAVIAADFEAVLAQTVHLPEAKLRPLFTDAQWNTVRDLFDAVKGEAKVDPRDLDNAALDVNEDPFPAALQAATPREERAKHAEKE